jgi:hypothetical protein
MKRLIQAVAVTLLAASTAQAQQAVQWRVQDGGNGHWYGTAEAVDWSMALVEAASRGAHLATPTSPAENQFVAQRLLTTNRSRGWIGLEQMNDQPTPDAGWHWVTGEALSWTNWLCFGGSLGCAPDDSPCFGQPWQVEDNQANCATIERNGTWDDLEKGPWCDGASRIALLEWSADCNGDGIVDYGQCRDGSLPDYDGNNLPDCCESSTPCVVGNYPVQWRVENGGNGHWYRRELTARTWPDAQAFAQSVGAHLATPTSADENSLIFTVSGGAGNTWIGGRQSPASCEPGCGWQWVTGETWSFTAWQAIGPQPDNTNGNENHLAYWGIEGGAGRWNDGDGSVVAPFTIEWSADCNGDGIVDYGQCRNGTLPDYNGNDIPDCCEAGTPCVVGNYPVQWRTAEGGSGHWYQWVGTSGCWSARQSEAAATGGHLACVVDLAELRFIQERSPGFFYLGGFRVSPVPDGDPADGWRWITGEPYNMSLYCPGWYPDNERWATGGPSANCVGESNECDGYWFINEWSADCNGDGIVDKGQILRGQLPDTNDNGVPDGCEVATCIDADIYRDFNVNGADLGILLSQWGTNTPLTESDLNADGAVDGVDLGILLSFWGPCP